MKIYAIDIHGSFGVTVGHTLCSSLLVAEKKIEQLKKADEDFKLKKEKEFGKAFPFFENEKEYKFYSIREVHLVTHEDLCN